MVSSSNDADQDFKAFQGAGYRLGTEGKVEPAPSLKRPRDTSALEDTAALETPTIGVLIDLGNDSDEGGAEIQAWKNISATFRWSWGLGRSLHISTT